MAKKKLEIPPQRSSTVIGLPSPPQKKASDYLNSYNSWVYAAINAIAQEVANVNLHLFTRKKIKGKMETVEVEDHEAKSLLYEVNDYMTHFQLFEITQIYLELTGEAYWAILRNNPNDKPQQIWPLRPDWVSINTSDKAFIDSYKYSPGGVNDPKAVTFRREDIIPFKYPNPINPYRGKGAVQAAAMAIDTDTFSADWNRNFFYNSAIPYLILRTKKKPSTEEIDRFLAQWEAKFQGRSNSHKIAMLTGDWDVPFVFGDKFKDMDFIEQRRLMRDEILGTFRVGKSSLNLTEDVNRANAEASNLNFMERTITPKMVRFVAHLNEFYLRINWPEEDLFFDFEDPAPQDVQMNLQIYESGKNYWMTPNEIRARENLEPVEGGDVIPIPFSMVNINSLDEDIKENVDPDTKTLFLKAKRRPVRKFKMPLPPMRLRDIRKEFIKKEIKHDVFKLVKNLISEIKDTDSKMVKKKRYVVSYAGQLNWTEEQKFGYWEKTVVRTEVYERNMMDTLRELFKEQEAEVLENLESQSKTWIASRRKNSASSFLFNVKRESKKWEKKFRPFIRHILTEKGHEVMDFLGVEQNLDLSQQRAASYLGYGAGRYIDDINTETRDRLKEELAQGLAKEESIQQLKKRVEGVFDIARGSRAVKIARTEVLRATNFATEEAYFQSDLVEAKEWLSARDGDVDPLCQELDGRVVELEGGFKEGSFTGDYPPLHPNCRCTLIPVLKSEACDNTKGFVSKLCDSTRVRDDDKLQDVDYKNPEEIKRLFDIDEYDGLTQEARNDLVKDEFAKVFPQYETLASSFDWQVEISDIKNLKVNIAADPDKVAEYVRGFKHGDKFPTLMVVDLNGERDLLDGAHRIEALEKLGAKKIPLLVGTPRP